MNTPKISVLVPVYNVEKYIEKCLDSIINQTYPNLEIILVDDGSTDNSGNICDEYARKDSRIKVIHQKNQGVAKSRNIAIASAGGEFIGFVDSDDFIDSNMYTDMMALALESLADIVMINFEYTDLNGQKIPGNTSSKPISDRIITGKQFISELCHDYNSTYVVPWNKIYRKKLFSGIQYPNGKTIDDEAVIHRLAHKCNTISFSSKAYYFYRQHPTSIMNKNFSLKKLDGLDALIDRIVFLEENAYDNNIILKSKLYLIHNCTAMFKKLDLKKSDHKDALKKYYKIIKPFCKELLRSNIPIKGERNMLIFMGISPFLYLKIFKR